MNFQEFCKQYEHGGEGRVQLIAKQVDEFEKNNKNMILRPRKGGLEYIQSLYRERKEYLKKS